MSIETIMKNPVLRFLIVGSLTFAVEYIVFYVLYVFAGWNLLVANSLSFAVGLGTSFTLNRVWAFKKAEFQRKVHHQIVIYMILAASNLVLNNVIVSVLQAMGLDPRIGKIVAIAIIAIWNFLIYKFIIFSERKEKAAA